MPIKKSFLHEGCSNMNASRFITVVNICYDKMVNVSILNKSENATLQLPVLYEKVLGEKY